MHHSCHRNRSFFVVLFFIVVLVISSASPSFCAKKKVVPAVQVQKIVEKEIQPFLEFIGHIETLQDVDLKARASGYIESVDFREGTKVTEGQSMFQIDAKTYQAEVNIAEAEVDQAVAELKKEQTMVSRMKKVIKGGVSEKDKDIAKNNVLLAKAKLKKAKANLDKARLQLSYTKVAAPISGRAGKSNYSKGSLIGPNSKPLVRIVQTDPVRAVFSVSELQLSEAQQARRESRSKRVIRLKLADGSIYSHDGSLEFLDIEVDERTGTIPVMTIFPNPEGSLVPGQFITVMVGDKAASTAPLVPQQAVMQDKEGSYVFVVDKDNIARIRRISLGVTSGINWVVEKGLEPGELVVINGIQKVEPDKVVTPSLIN